MTNGLEKIEEVIDYIEKNITAELDCNMLAAKMNLSVYEFRRIFSFVVGCPISEYIRKRRLSVAACEILMKENLDMLAISQKYGYANQSSFIKAFKEQHGVSPTAYYKGKTEIKLFTRPSFSFSLSGREETELKIIKTEDFFVQGFKGVSEITDSCCCEKVWNDFYESGADMKLTSNEIYACYRNIGSRVDCTIGQKTSNAEQGTEFIKIEKSSWACFKMNTVDDDLVNKQYSKIIYELLPSANLKKRNDLPTVEVYPFDMTTEGFDWEIRIPIE